MRGKDTPERILDVSLRMFLTRGYDTTSLREIADELGVTKAALYYHFKSKEDIFRELLLPFDHLLADLAANLGAAKDIAGGRDALISMLIQTVDDREILELVQRNYTAVSALERFEARRLSDRMHDIQLAVMSITPDVRAQVRIFAALAAITRFDEWAVSPVSVTTPEVLLSELTAIVDDILQVPPRRSGAAQS